MTGEEVEQKQGEEERRIMKRNVRGGAPLVCQLFTVCVCMRACVSVCTRESKHPAMSQ